MPMQLRRPIADIDTVLEDTLVLDESQQEMLVDALRAENERVNRLYLNAVVCLCGVLAAVFVFLAGHQMVYPYMAETHAFLSSTVASSHIVAMHVVAAASLSATIAYICTPPSHAWLVVAASLASIPALYWSYAFSSFLSYPLHIVWLPATPAVMAAIAWYVRRGCEQLDNDVTELRSYMYPAKGA